MDLIIEIISFVIVTLFLSTIFAAFGGAIGMIMYENYSKKKGDRDNDIAFHAAFYTALIILILVYFFWFKNKERNYWKQGHDLTCPFFMSMTMCLCMYIHMNKHMDLFWFLSIF